MTIEISNEDFMGYVPSSNNYEMLPEGSYDYVIQAVIGLGLQETTYEGKPKTPQARIRVIFEIPKHLKDGAIISALGLSFITSKIRSTALFCKISSQSSGSTKSPVAHIIPVFLALASPLFT